MLALFSNPQNFKDKRVSVKKAISILEKNNISVDEEEAKIILDFLYLMAKSTEAEGAKILVNPTEHLTSKK